MFTKYLEQFFSKAKDICSRTIYNFVTPIFIVFNYFTARDSLHWFLGHHWAYGIMHNSLLLVSALYFAIYFSLSLVGVYRSNMKMGK